MINFSNSYLLGGFCLHLNIVSYRSLDVNEIKKRLIPLSAFQTSNYGEGAWLFDIVEVYDSAEIQEQLHLQKITAQEMDIYVQNSSTSTDLKHFLLMSRDFYTLPPERILLSVMVLATWWHVIHKGACLHAAAVSYNGAGILFLGESGAGKSTISNISADLGIPVLAEDRVFLLPNQNEYLLAAGPHPATGYVNYSSLRSNLCNVFILIKDQSDYIKPVLHSEAAKKLFAAFLQNSASSYLPSDMIKLAFAAIADIARKIPAFELHFRKSPDFWRVIDEQVRS